LVSEYPYNLEVSNEAKECVCYGAEISGGVRNLGNEMYVNSWKVCN